MAYSGGSTLHAEESGVIGEWLVAVVIKLFTGKHGWHYPGLMARDNRGFDIPVAVQHVAQYVVKSRQGRFAGNVMSANHLLLRDQTKGPAHRFRGVMKSRFQSDLRVVQAVGI